MNLSQSLERYLATLTALEEAQPQPSGTQILDVLKARDEIHSALAAKAQDPPEDLIKLLQLDSRLKQQTARISQVAKLADWRASLQPPAQAWWWFLEAPSSRWDRFDWLWTALTILC